MVKIIIVMMMVVPSFAFARGPRMSDADKAKLKKCNISRPERGADESTREAHHKSVEACLGRTIDKPEKGERGRRPRNGDRASSTVN